MIRVKAMTPGWYKTRRREGDEFEIADRSELGKWMKVIGPDAEAEAKPEPKRKAQTAI